MKYDWLQNLILRAGVDRKAYQQAQASIENSNRSSLCVYSAVATLFLIIMFLSSFSLETLQGYSMVYFLSALFSGAALIYGTLLYHRYPTWLLPCIYGFMVMMFVFGIVLGIADPTVLGVTFIVLLLAIPLLFTDRPLRMIFLIIGAMLTYDAIILNFKTGDVLYTDLVNCTIYGLLSCVVSTHMMTVKVGRIVFSERSDMLSKTDLLTDCKNRNCYEQELKAYAVACTKSLACVYVDVNGLHEMNDNHGHTAGDIMLQFVAERMRSTFGESNTYRIGGDEFVSLISDVDHGEIELKINQILMDIENANYHIAVGYDLHPKTELNLNSLIHTAEEHMYASKHTYYETTGAPRRKSR